MCVSPLMIERRYAGMSKIDIVPCGRCHECISKKQNEFAALACLEAQRSTSMWFFTFTYSNSSVPVMCNWLGDRLELFQDFVADSSRSKVLPLMGDMTGKKPLELYKDGAFTYVPSLRREDVRLFLKRCRVAYERKFGKKIDFKYAGFGEYGDRTNRPHYHFLFYNLDKEQAAFLKDAWASQFGFCDACEIPFLNRDGSPARVKVTKYVAKYLGKPKKDFEPLLKGLCESPRRISSKSFGLGVCEEKLKSFIYAKI